MTFDLCSEKDAICVQLLYKKQKPKEIQSLQKMNERNWNTMLFYKTHARFGYLREMASTKFNIYHVV